MVLADPANAPFIFDRASEGQISLSSSLGVVAALDLSLVTDPTEPVKDASSKPKICFGINDTRNYNKDDTPKASSKNSFAALAEYSGGDGSAAKSWMEECNGGAARNTAELQQSPNHAPSTR